MSLLAKRIFSTIWFKNFSNYTELNLNRTQYYRCLSSPFYVKFQKAGHQQISSLQALRKLNIRKANNFLMNAIDKIFVAQKFKQKHIGFLWYKTLDEINRDEFFNYLQMPDTYFSWFKVVKLHVWMLLFQLRQNGSQLRYVRDGVVEAMWLDLEKRAVMLNKSSKTIRKNFLIMNEKFKLALFWYDYGYLENDSTLATVVWNVFFEKQNDDPEKLEAVVKYIRFQMNHLQSLDFKTLDDNVKKGVWTSLKPHCKGFLT